MFVRLVRFAGSVAFIVASVLYANAQTLTPSAAGDSHVHATLRLSSGATQYRQGELIQLQFTSDQPEQFEIGRAHV